MDSSTWSYGDVNQGTTDFAFKIRHSVADPAGTYVDWLFTITLRNPCYDDAGSRSTTAADIAYTVEADGTTTAVTSTANVVNWSNGAGVAACA